MRNPSNVSLCNKCPYSEFSGPFFPAFEPENLQIRTLFKQCIACLDSTLHREDTSAEKLHSSMDEPQLYSKVQNNQITSTIF